MVRGRRQLASATGRVPRGHGSGSPPLHQLCPYLNGLAEQQTPRRQQLAERQGRPRDGDSHLRDGDRQGGSTVPLRHGGSVLLPRLFSGQQAPRLRRLGSRLSAGPHDGPRAARPTWPVMGSSVRPGRQNPGRQRWPSTALLGRGHAEGTPRPAGRVWLYPGAGCQPRWPAPSVGGLDRADRQLVGHDEWAAAPPAAAEGGRTVRPQPGVLGRRADPRRQPGHGIPPVLGRRHRQGAAHSPTPRSGRSQGCVRVFLRAARVARWPACVRARSRLWPGRVHATCNLGDRYGEAGGPAAVSRGVAELRLVGQWEGGGPVLERRRGTRGATHRPEPVPHRGRGERRSDRSFSGRKIDRWSENDRGPVSHRGRLGSGYEQGSRGRRGGPGGSLGLGAGRSLPGHHR